MLISKKNDAEKIIELISIFDYLANTVNFKLYKNEIFMIYD